MHELPLIQSEDPPGRADAARNRERILLAARRLFAEKGASCVSIDDVAEAAGVGMGLARIKAGWADTVRRRFGEVASAPAG